MKKFLVSITTWASGSAHPARTDDHDERMARLAAAYTLGTRMV